MGPSSHRVLASGCDESGLGRWVWTLLAGKNQTKLRIISGYRPNPDSSDRTGSVFSQQERHLRNIHDDRNPRRAYVKDQQTALTIWSTEGNLTTMYTLEMSTPSCASQDLSTYITRNIPTSRRCQLVIRTLKTYPLTASGPHLHSIVLLRATTDMAN